MYTKIKKYLKDMTITSELARLGRLNRVTHKFEMMYNERKVSPLGVLLYRVLLAIPTVILMRLFPITIPLIDRLAKIIWIERVAKLQHKWMKKRYRGRRNK